MTISIKVRALSINIRSIAANRQSPLVVAIDGRSGSGKSTLAKALVRDLSAALLQGDDFFAGDVEVSQDDAKTLANRCTDRKAQIRVLERLHNNRAATFYPFDWEIFDGNLSSTAVTIEPRPIVIFEGVYSSHPELKNLVNYRILLSIPEEERMRRLVLREGQFSEWERQWHRAEDWYFSNLATIKRFDAVIE